MSVEALKSFFDVAAVALLFLTFAAGAGVLITGSIVDGRQKEKIREFDADLTKAKSDLATQQERAATADARVAGLEKDASGAKAAQQEVEIELATQKTRAANAELSLLELRKRAEPRRLTASQREELKKLLTGGEPNGVAIVTPLMDGEAQEFGDEFNSVLQAANWETMRIVNRVSSSFGIVVVTCEGTKGPALLRAKRLSDALTSVGISHSWTTFKADDASTDPHFQVGYVYLVIEHKPI